MSVYDRYAERRELLAAGWEPKDSCGAVVWKNPWNGYWYPQQEAIELARAGVVSDLPPRKPEETPS